MSSDLDLLRLASLSERLMVELCHKLNIPHITETEIDLLAEHQALLLVTSSPLATPTTVLLSDSAELLGTFRKVVSVTRVEEAGGRDLYSLLYPPGWCLLDQLEESHRLGEDTINSCSASFIPAAYGERWASSSNLIVLDRYSKSYR